MPWSGHERGKEKRRAKVDDGGRRERTRGVVIAMARALGDERHHHELQTDQRSGGSAHDHVETFPVPELRHVAPPPRRPVGWIIAHLIPVGTLNAPPFAGFFLYHSSRSSR